MANRLAEATSPYLQQHKDNPVDWWQWGPEAFAEARRRDVPLFISVGYAACHWCHVMAHESFDDPAVAGVINEYTVPVKVDREERPDVDAVYMTATQAMTGQGGWPMSVFATPDGEPFLAGTYFPPQQFVRLLRQIAAAWEQQRDAVLRQGRAVVDALAGAAAPPSGAGAPPTAELLDEAAGRLATEHDRRHGGFGGAPKFPPSMVLEFLLRRYARTGDATSLQVVRHTCERMARGGMYDQLAGGFARYSVDERWLVPHFEKMLYDNALLLRAYTHLWRATGDPLAGRVAAETVGFLLTDLRTEQGGFASALDADTDGVEGATYVWTPEQLTEVLGDDDGRWAAELLEVTAEGTFEEGASVLQLPVDPDDPGRWDRVRAALLAARRQRPQPARDDKVVAAWNGLAISALAEYAAIAPALAGSGTTPAPDDGSRVTELAAQAARAAVAAGELLAGLHQVDGRLRRVSRAGRVGEPCGVLEDYGCVAEAYCLLHQLTGEGRWLALAGSLLDSALTHFPAGGGAFYDTADDAEQLVSRPQDPTDNATPSGASALAGALVSYAALAGSGRHREVADAALGRVAQIIGRYPRFAGWAAAVAEASLAGPRQVAVVGGGAAADALRAAAWRSTSPGAVVVAGVPDATDVPLLADRPLVGGEPAAYVCQGFVCDRPVTGVEELAAQLSD